MRRAAAPLGMVLVLAACAGQGEPRGFKPLANPSAIVAVEFAFAQDAQDKGQWTAFRDYAAKDAVMFVPQPVEARDWLKKQTDPATAVKWEVHSVWMSCDGSLAVSKGAWQRTNTFGYFTTVWQRQKRDEYKWTLDQGDGLAEPLAPPDMVAGSVADCSSRPQPPEIAAAPAGVDQRVGWSDDRTLYWIVRVQPDNARTFGAFSWTGHGYDEVVNSEVAAGTS